MNVFSKNGVRIDYAARMDRFSISTGNGWISVSPTVFSVLVAIALDQNRHVKIKVQMNGVRNEIIKVSSTYMISYASRSTNSTISIHEEVMSSIVQDYDTIMDVTTNHKKVKSFTPKSKLGADRNSKYFECINLFILYMKCYVIMEYIYIYM